MSDLDREFILGAECLVAVAVSLLPTGLAAGCFALIGRRESRLPGVVTRVTAHAVALCDLLMLVILSIFCLLGIVLGTFRSAPPVTLLAGLLLVIALLQGGAVVLLIRWSRTRSLVCWSFGSLLGMFIATGLLALGVVVGAKNASHGGVLFLFAALSVYPLALSSGPLLMVPAIWMWKQRVQEPIVASRP